MSEVASGVFAEAALLAACLLTGVELLAELLPLMRISGTQVLGGEKTSLASNGCHEADRSAYHDGRNDGFATSGSSFMIAHRPETLFQVIVGRRQIWDIVAMKEPWGKAVGGPHKMLDGLGDQWAKLRFLLLDGDQPLLQASADQLAVAVLRIGQDRSRLMHQSVGLLDRREQGGGRL